MEIRSPAANRSTFDAKLDGRRTVQPIPLARTASSPSRCHSPMTSPSAVVSPVPIADSFTTRATPASRAAASRARSCREVAVVGAVSRNTASTPSTARRSDSGSSKSARTPCGPEGVRDMARSGTPRPVSCRTTSPPMVPVAPVIRIMRPTLPDSGPSPIGSSGTHPAAGSAYRGPVSFVEQQVRLPAAFRPWAARMSVATPVPGTARTVLAEPDHATTLSLREDAFVVIGPRTRARYHEPKRFRSCLTIRLRPGLAGALLGLPVRDLVDRVVPLRDLWPGDDLTDVAAVDAPWPPVSSPTTASCAPPSPCSAPSPSTPPRAS